VVTEIIDFTSRTGSIGGMLVLSAKQVSDERGTVREIFRRSAFEAAGISLPEFRQVNVTESRRGAVRGLHAEDMTKLTSVASGAAFGVYVDLRPDSPTFGLVDTVDLLPGVEVVVPAGVANGFQAVSDPCHYVYCFDAEWLPDMPGSAVTPLDPHLAIAWPIPIDPDDPSQISRKDRDAPRLADLEPSEPTTDATIDAAGDTANEGTSS
jgi:dTDP-4-dehydrorhamnose 3,5-epimerase